MDDHKDKKTRKEIVDGLTEVLNGLTDEQLAKLSKHLSGDAFDVQPVTKLPSPDNSLAKKEVW
jgi:hypothetical protein